MPISGQLHLCAAAAAFYHKKTSSAKVHNLLTKKKPKMHKRKLVSCYIISVDTDWYDEGDKYLYVANVTYKITPNVIDECLCF